MKTYEITIKPLSGFATPLKGDTLFGHICWQAVYNESLFGKNLDKLLSDYSTNPFLVISSAFLKVGEGFALKRPDMPLDMLFKFDITDKADLIAKRKELKGKRWMLLKNNSYLQSLKAQDLYLNDEQLFGRGTLQRAPTYKDDITQRQLRKHGIKSFIADYTQPHNTINRLTGTTGEGRFAPYSVDQKVFIKETELVIFAGLRDDIAIDSIINALKQIGVTGFGKDASTGLGRFEVSRYREINLSSFGSREPNACYTLAPCVPEKDAFKDMFFSPFTRFGRHGDILAKSRNPFKNPVIMADEGAVFIVNNPDVFKKPYIGRAIFGISKAESKAVTQGFSLYIPVRMEG